MLGNYWDQAGFWDKAFVVYGVLFVFVFAAFVLRRVVGETPTKKLDFIKKAYEENRTVIGKLSCLTLHYKKGVRDHYQAEYMYMVDGKSYFVTYKMAVAVPDADTKEQLNADMVLMTLRPFVILYYDAEKPENVLCKTEIFTSVDAFERIKTPRKNVYRDVKKQWTEPIHIK